MNRPVLFLLSISICILVIGTTFGQKHRDYAKFAPPNGVEISDGLYADISEISNQDWLEYLSWNERIFGKSSPSYKAILPDTSVWAKLNTAFTPFVTQYLRSPDYLASPVVGITRGQAEAYSLWRSDRVMEQILSNAKVKLPKSSDQDSTNYFSIQLYLSGHWQLPYDSTFKYVPHFYLPSPKERLAMLEYNERTLDEYYENCKTDHCRACKSNNEMYNLENYDSVLTQKDKSQILIPAKQGCSASEIGLYHIIGNVAEWTSNEGIAAGGGWVDHKDLIASTDLIYTLEANCWTGFRNVFYWKKVD